MSFKEQHPNYKTYEENDLYFSQFPSSFWDALQGFILRHSQNEDELKGICNRIAEIIPTSPTKNWGWDFLENDLDDFVRKISKMKFAKIMDFLQEFASNKCGIDEMNELLEDNEIGYYLVEDELGGSYWEMKNPQSARIKNIEDVQEEIKDYFEEALEHLQQASEHLQETHSSRDIKDAVRDCLSATESVLKKLTNKNDIKDATTFLRAEKKWGPDIIVKDGLSVWDRIQNLYPDIRHGQKSKSEITEEEAVYWIDRIMGFLRYLVRQKRKIGA